MEFKAFRDVAVFTDKKIIAVNVQGLTGTKVEVLVLPYSKMTAYAVESAGGFDLDAELKVWSSGIGLVEFEFVRGQVDVRALATLLSRVVGVSESKSIPAQKVASTLPVPKPVPVEPVLPQSPQRKCSACGTEANAEQRFCRQCGAALK